MFTGLFNSLTENVGRSIKQIAKAAYVIQVIIGIIVLICALFFLAQFCDDGREEAIVVSIVCFCVFLSFVMSAALSVVMLYAFGALVESNDNISKNSNLLLKEITDTNNKIYALNSNGKEKTEGGSVDSQLHAENKISGYTDIVCYNCKNIVSVSNKTILAGITVFCPHCHGKINLSSLSQ